MQNKKKKVETHLNKILLPNLNLQGFFNGIEGTNQYIKFKSPVNLSKYDLKVFLYDVYGIKNSKVHSKIERIKKKSTRKSKQKKVFWLNTN